MTCYDVIIPAHNEESFLEGLLNSLLNQQLLPRKIIVVNDNSSDKTELIIDEFVQKSSLIVKVNNTSSQEHLPGSKIINAFNVGLAMVEPDYDFIVKLDADLILNENYFHKIASIFKNDPKIGIAGGFAYEKNIKGVWERNHPMHSDHVRGAFKSYSKKCFKEIGGLKNAIGWDTVDELLARFYGFKVYTDDNLKVKHLRPTGKSYNKKAKYMQGEAMYKMGYGWKITTIAALKMALKSKKPTVFFDCLMGYRMSKKKKHFKLVTPEQEKFIRRFRWKRIFKKFYPKA